MTLWKQNNLIRVLALTALALCAQAALAQPSLAVRDNLGTVIPDGGTYAQGNHSEPQYNFGMQLRNNGTSDLSVSNVAFTAMSNCNITSSGTYPRIVAPGTQYIVSSIMFLTSGGPYSATCTVTSNDPVTPSYVITISGTATNAPNIRVTWSSGGVSNGGSQWIGSQYAPATSFNVTLTVTNYAIAAANDLVFDAVDSLDLQTSSNCNVMLPADPTGFLIPGGSLDIVLSVTPTAVGPFSFVPRVYTNDPDTNPWSATFDGSATNDPIMRVLIEGGYRPHNSSQNVSGAMVGMAFSIDCSVMNSGSASLLLTGTPLVEFSAEVNCGCALVTPPATPIASTAQSNFEITVTAAAAGNFSFDITIESNDPATPSYVVHITGTTVGAPQNLNLLLGGSSVAHNGTHAPTGAVKGTAFNLQGGLQNTGDSTLTLTGTPLVAISAPVNCTAVVLVDPLTSVPGAQTSTFTVQVTPTDSGTFSFTITVASDDPDTPSYVVIVQGSASKPGSGDDGGDDSGCSTGSGGTSLVCLLALLALAAPLLRRRA